VSGITFKHGFKNWESAAAVTTGYQGTDFSDQLVKVSRQARDGEIKFERDGVAFDDQKYSWELLACLLASLRSNMKMRILDVGGALGTTYRQNRKFLQDAGVVFEWIVLEQRYIAQIGQQEFTTAELSFVSSINDIIERSFDVVIFASSLCYLPNAEELIEEVKDLSPNHIILDRTPISSKLADLYGIQKVRLKGYKISYPIRSFGQGKIEELFLSNYQLIESWVCDEQPDPKTKSMGFYFGTLGNL
jgi:putative methyltransferase (TIGR04325 family)